jgi:hypothetical protein
MKYWMSIFTPDTWQQFLAMPQHVCAFNDLPGRRFPDLSLGDHLLCYVSKEQVWAGVLAVNGPRYRSVDHLYTGGLFPNRVSVTPLVLLTPLQKAVRMSALEGRLSFFPAGTGGKKWAPHVRISPRVMHTPDALAIVAAVQEASGANA